MMLLNDLIFIIKVIKKPKPYVNWALTKIQRSQNKQNKFRNDLRLHNVAILFAVFRTFICENQDPVNILIKVRKQL